MDYLFRRSFLAALVVSFLGVEFSRGDLIACWDFNDANLVVDQGSGILTTTFLPGDLGFLPGTTKNARPGVAAGQALRLEDRVNNAFGRLDFTLTMTGYRGMAMSLASQKTSTGFNSNQISYSSNGGTSFTNFGLPLNPPAAFDISTFDLSGINTLNNNPHVMLRITFDGASTASGNNRIDNVLFTATAMDTVASPEPGSATLAGVGVLMVVVRRGLRKLLRRREEGVRCQ